MTTVFRGTVFRKFKSSMPVKEIGIYVAVFAIGYGIAHMAEHPNSLANAATASSSETPTYISKASPTIESSAAEESRRPVAVGEGRDDPRECAPDKGITEACIYD